MTIWKLHTTTISSRRAPLDEMTPAFVCLGIVGVMHGHDDEDRPQSFQVFSCFTAVFVRTCVCVFVVM